MSVPAVIACVRACVAQPISSHPLGAMPPIRPLNRQGLSYCDNGLLYETTGLNGQSNGGGKEFVLYSREYKLESMVVL